MPTSKKLLSPSYDSFSRSPFRTLKVNSYFPVYDRLLENYRDRNITFVEIGVLAGGSLFMWRDFLGPKARIIGVDLNPAAKKWEDHGFEIYIGSQSDRSFWHQFCEKIGEIDVVLDDGGHTYEQQITTVEELAPSIAEGGIIIVEDTHTSYMSGFGPRQYSLVNYAKKTVDAINCRHSDVAGVPEYRFWSVEFFESIVAFKFNKQVSALNGSRLDNGGLDDAAVDFRYEYEPENQSFLVRFLRSIPVRGKLGRLKKSLITYLEFSCRKHF